MRTAVDSSVLLTVFRRQSGWEDWQRKLSAASREGPLLISPVVFAECASGFPDWETELQAFQSLGLEYDPILPDSAYLAGQIHQAYRKAGGSRQTMVPDFLIAAHAACQADRLAAVDRGYLRNYFPELMLL